MRAGAGRCPARALRRPGVAAGCAAARARSRSPPAAQAAAVRATPSPARPGADPDLSRSASASTNRGAAFCVGCGRTFGPLRPAILRVVEPVRAAWEMPVARSPMMLGRASEAEGY